MFRHKFSAAVFGAALLAAGSASADAVIINFDSFSLGALPGGPIDTRTAGNASKWWVPDNAATSGAVVANEGRGGSNALLVGNRGNGNNGVIENVKSGKLAQAAGESSSGAPNSSFQSSFWFRTASRTAVTDFAFATESWGTDRTTLLGFSNGTNGIQVDATGRDAAGKRTESYLSQELSWGTWYRVVTDILFADGSLNDVVTFSIFGEGGGQVGSSLVVNSWEEGQRQLGYNGGQQVAVDTIGFQSRFSPAGVNGAVYIDDVSWSSGSNAVPEPASLALVLSAGLAALGASRRRNKV